MTNAELAEIRALLRARALAPEAPPRASLTRALRALVRPRPSPSLLGRPVHGLSPEPPPGSVRRPAAARPPLDLGPLPPSTPTRSAFGQRDDASPMSLEPIHRLEPPALSAPPETELYAQQAEAVALRRTLARRHPELVRRDEAETPFLPEDLADLGDFDAEQLYRAAGMLPHEAQAQAQDAAQVEIGAEPAPPPPDAALLDALAERLEAERKALAARTGGD